MREFKVFPSLWLAPMDQGPAGDHGIELKDVQLDNSLAFNGAAR
jgi:hypothetical protein